MGCDEVEVDVVTTCQDWPDWELTGVGCDRQYYFYIHLDVY